MAQTHDIEWYLAQVRRIAEHREKGAEKEIRKLYKEMLKDLQSFIGTQYALLAEDDQLTYGILQAKGEAARFLEEVEANINSVSPKVQRQIRDVVEQTYTAAYTGMIDAVEKAHNLEELRINLDGIRGTTPETVKKAVENPVSGLTLSDTLEKHRKEVIYEIKRQIGVGLIAGDRYSTMARRISDQLDMDYRKSIRIVRTETHRVREAGAQEGAEAVQEKLKSADSEYRLVKIWRTMKDERVRPQRKAYRRKAGVKARKQYTAGLRSSLSGPNHMKMEGQTVLLDEPFDLGGGVKAMVPGSSGVAGHDINCRCYTSEKLMNDEEFFKATGRHFKNVLTKVKNGDNTNLKGIGIQFFANAGIPKQTNLQLEKSIKSWKTVVAVHKDKVKNPAKYDAGWYEKSEQHKAGLLKHWEKEIRHTEKNIEEAEAELLKRGIKHER